MNEQVGAFLLIGLSVGAFGAMLAVVASWCPSVCDSHAEGRPEGSGAAWEGRERSGSSGGGDDIEEGCTVRVMRTAVVTDGGVQLVPTRVCLRASSTGVGA